MLKKLFSIFFTKKQKPNRYQHWIDARGSVPKAGDKKMLLLTLVLMLLIAASCSPKGTLNCGSTYKLHAPKFKA